MLSKELLHSLEGLNNKKNYKTMAKSKQHFQNKITPMSCWTGQKIEEQQNATVMTKTFKHRMEVIVLDMGK